MTPQSKSNGLDGVSIGTTTLSLVNGEEGKLAICGYDVEELAETKTFEDVTLLLLHGQLPGKNEVSEFIAELSRARQLIYDRRAFFESAFGLNNPLDSLRAAVALLSAESSFEKSTALVLGAIPMFIGAWYQAQNQRPLPAPIANQSTAAAILHVLGRADCHELEQALSKYLLTVSDHGMNASTFTARVIASTQSDVISSVTGAIGALKGPLHGGAPGPVLEMLAEIGEPRHAAEWIRKKLLAKERIMGMGHRIYRVRDPRAAVFEQILKKLPAKHLNGERLNLARAVEKEAEKQLAMLKPDRPLKANVEFYTAVLLETCGIPGELFTAVFAGGRAAGWLAHFAEQKNNGRLIRPTVDYVGATRSAKS